MKLSITTILSLAFIALSSIPKTDEDVTCGHTGTYIAFVHYIWSKSQYPFRLSIRGVEIGVRGGGGGASVGACKHTFVHVCLGA